MNKPTVVKLGYLLAITSLLFNPAQASILVVDNFSHEQKVVDLGNSVGATSAITDTTLAGTDLDNVTREFIAEAKYGKKQYQTKIEVRHDGAGLSVSNDHKSAVLASILWNFEPIDFTGYGDTLVFEIKKLNLGVNVEFIVNGISGSGVKSFTELGDVEFSFSDFLQPNLFKTVNSLRLNFTGPSSWDGTFGALSVVNRSTPQVGSVPLPSSMLLMASALVGLITLSRSRNANQT